MPGATGRSPMLTSTAYRVSCTYAWLLLPELSILPGVGQPRKLFPGLLSVSGNVASWDNFHSGYPRLQVAAHAC